MQTVKIISDSTCDLSESLKEKFNVGIVPLHVVLGEKVYEDGINVTQEQIFAWTEETKKAPKTAAPTPEEAAKIFQSALRQYQEIVSFSIAGGMSSSNAAMHLAAKKLKAEERIHVIDSASLSGGIGLLVLEAAELAEKGADGKTIAAHIERQKPLVRASFVVDTLMYLYRGGRCSGLTALAGQTLKLHPKISVVNGEMTVGKKYRGRIERVIMNYAHDLEPELKTAQPGRVFITHSGCSAETENEVYEYLKSLDYFQDICVTHAGGVVSCHCGPGTLGVLYLSGGIG